MKTKLLILLLVLMIAGVLVTNVSASTNGDYGIDWWTVEGGGGTSEGGDYSLSGTIGQPDAGVSSGGIYALSGGFWRSSYLYIFPLFMN
ncbi:MAG: hypothetical protein ACOCYU_03265 [Brevefilum sp.]